MNKVILMGRLTRDPETRNSDKATVTRYSLAVNRSYKRDGEPDADFINVVAFGARGEFAAKYFKKGMQVAVVGELRIGSYTNKDGQKVNTADVVVSEQYFADSKRDGAAASAPAAAAPEAPELVPVEDDEDDLPF